MKPVRDWWAVEYDRETGVQSTQVRDLLDRNCAALKKYADDPDRDLKRIELPVVLCLAPELEESLEFGRKVKRRFKKENDGVEDRIDGIDRSEKGGMR